MPAKKTEVADEEVDRSKLETPTIRIWEFFVAQLALAWVVHLISVGLRPRGGGSLDFVETGLLLFSSLIVLVAMVWMRVIISGVPLVWPQEMAQEPEKADAVAAELIRDIDEAYCRATGRPMPPPPPETLKAMFDRRATAMEKLRQSRGFDAS